MAIMKLTSLKLLDRIIYEWLEIVGHIGRNENADEVVISNKVVNTFLLRPFEHVKY